LREKILKVKVLRYNPEQDKEAKYQIYEIPIKGTVFVLQILNYIYENIDPTIAYRRHLCLGAWDSETVNLCKACLILINGKPGFACSTVVEGDEITLEPMRGYELIRDLVVDFSKKKNEN
jgi:succinate dehydrogenase/fumarate reductase-like Fe-S protein